MEIMNVYCDESCHLERDGHKSMVLGGIYCPINRVSDICNKIRDLKEKYNLPRRREVKWVKISNSKKEFYIELVEFFLKDEYLKFRALKIPNKSCLRHNDFNQTHDQWYYKMYYDMLKQIIRPYTHYNVYIDIKDTLGNDKILELKEFLKINSFNKECVEIKKVQRIRSYESELLQLADIFIGMVGYEDRMSINNYNEVKLDICSLVKDKLGIDFSKTSNYSNSKFNLLVWEGA